MNPTITHHEDDQRQLHVTLEFAEATIEPAMRETAKKLAKQVRIPGFRPGKAPLGVIMQRYGEEAMRFEILEKWLQENMANTLMAENIEPYAPISLEDMSAKPARIELIVPLTPVVTLGDYRAIRRELGTAEITEEAVDAAVEALRERNAKTEDVEDRTAELGDWVEVVGVGALVPQDAAEDWVVDHSSEDQLFHDHEGTAFILDETKTYAGTDFVQHLVGAKVGDTLHFNIRWPEGDDFGASAGREAQFDLQVTGVQTREMPELNDEFAQSLDETFATLADLREAERTRLQKAAESRLKNEFVDGMVEELIAGATMVYPPAAVAEQINDRIEKLKKQVERYGWKWADYLQMQEVTEESFHTLWQESAVMEVQQTLALQHFVRAEQITVLPEDLDAEIEKRITDLTDKPYYNEEFANALREQFKKDNDQNLSLLNDIILAKVTERMVQIGAGNAPDLTAEPEVPQEEQEEESDTAETA